MMSSSVSIELLSPAGVGQRVLHGQRAGDGHVKSFHSASQTGKAKITESHPDKGSSSRLGSFFLGFPQRGGVYHHREVTSRVWSPGTHEQEPKPQFLPPALPEADWEEREIFQ